MGGILKGAIGAGSPLIAVPILALLVDVPFAVAVFVMPNIISNAIQAWRFRAHIHDHKFAMRYSGFGILGVFFGTLALAGFSSQALMMCVSFAVLAYVVFRIVNPEWKLSSEAALRLSAPLGGAAGVLQGATGISAPLSVTFMNALGLERRPFIATMTLFFVSMAVVQLPMQAAIGVMTFERLFYSLLATIPMLAGMPVGAYLAKFIPRTVFDKIILALLTILAIRLLMPIF